MRSRHVFAAPIRKSGMLIAFGLTTAALFGVAVGVLRGERDWPAFAVLSAIGTVACLFGVGALRSDPGSCAGSFCAPNLLGLAAVVLGGLFAVGFGVAAVFGALHVTDNKITALGVLPLLVFAAVLGPSIARSWSTEAHTTDAADVARRFFQAARDGDVDRACRETSGWVRNNGDFHPCPEVVAAIRGGIPSELRVMDTSRLDSGTYVVWFHQGAPNVVAYVTNDKVELADAD
jgi:hypothetical protein